MGRRAINLALQEGIQQSWFQIQNRVFESMIFFLLEITLRNLTPVIRSQRDECQNICNWAVGPKFPTGVWFRNDVLAFGAMVALRICG